MYELDSCSCMCNCAVIFNQHHYVFGMNLLDIYLYRFLFATPLMDNSFSARSFCYFFLCVLGGLKLIKIRLHVACMFLLFTISLSKLEEQ